MQNPRIPIKDRKTTFKEVEKNFTTKQMLKEANRCLQCANPLCVNGCPAQINIPEFIKFVKEGKLKKAAKTIRESNYFPSICGRICQHEKQCEAACVLANKNEAICIGGLERYVGDNTVLPTNGEHTNGKTAAIIGSGPSGLTAAAYLAREGINVSVFEVSNSFGGVIKYGVPEFRLPKEVVARELKGLHNLGIDFEPNAKIAEESMDEVAKKFDVVFVGTGVGATKKIEVKGSKLKGIISAIKFLVNLNQSDMPMIDKGERVVVVGAGYVGIDAARSAIRLGAKKVTCVTISHKEDALKSVSEKDYDEAEEEGVKFLFGFKVDRFEGKEKVEKVHYSNGKKGFLKANKVLVAIGQKHDKDELKKPLRNGENGCINVNEKHQTKLKNVFAAGDCVHGPKTVIHAIATGRDTARAMIKYLENNDEKAKLKKKKDKIKEKNGKSKIKKK
jgi:glutamate synthase (NADPH) small chain